MHKKVVAVLGAEKEDQGKMINILPWYIPPVWETLVGGWVKGLEEKERVK